MRFKKSKCKFCNKTFEYYPKDSKGYFCSRKCYHKSRIGKKLSKTHCENIGKSRKGMVFSKEHIKNLKKAFKGRKSKRKGISYVVEFGVEKAKQIKKQISKNRKGKCIGHNYGFKKGQKPWNYIDGRSKTLGPARYGDDWFKIRLLVYKRDNYTCQRCGVTMEETGNPHHIHHIVPFLISFDNSLNNLITLCPSCHRKIEAKIMLKLKRREVKK